MPLARASTKQGPQEDFGLNNAARLLERYREDIPVFNDDIQGTGCTALAALKAAAKVCDINLHEMRIVCFGAGSAGMGNAMQIAKGVAVEGAMSMEEARKHIWSVVVVIWCHISSITCRPLPMTVLTADDWTGASTGLASFWSHMGTS